MRLEFDSRVNVEMLSLFLDENVTGFESRDTLDFEALLKLPDICMVLDPHAVLEGQSNYDVAKKLLQAAPPKITQCDYFDAKTNLMTSLKKDAMVEGRTLTYCDQKHTTGTDTVQPVNGVGIVLINKGFTFTELVQSSKRLRGLGKGQKIVLSLTKELVRVIFEEMGEDKLSSSTFLLWTLLNESKMLEKSLSVAFEQQLHSIYRNALIKSLLICSKSDDPALFMKKRALLCRTHRQLLVDKVDNYEFITFANLAKDDPAFDKFSKIYNDYKRTHNKLFDYADTEQLTKLKAKAKTYLAKEGFEIRSERLNLTDQKEEQKQTCRENQDAIETEKKNTNWRIWDLNKLISGNNFKKWVSSEGLSPRTSCAQFNELTVVPICDMILNVKLHHNFYASINYFQNRVKARGGITTVVINKLPSFKYLFVVENQSNFPKYIIVQKDEANMIRGAIKAIQEAKTKTNLSFSLYLKNGHLVESYGSEKTIQNEVFHTIFAQANFLNGSTLYKGHVREALKKWLAEEGTAAKIACFMERSQQNKLVHETPIQKIFDEVMFLQSRC